MVPPDHSRISRYHAFIARRPLQVLVGALLIAGLGASLAIRLKLKTAFSELLPSNDPGVVALARTQKRLGDMSLLLIGIRSPDHEANLRYAEALTRNCARCRRRSSTSRPTTSRTCAASSRTTSGSTPPRTISRRSAIAADRISKKKNPLFVSLGDDEPIDSMRKRMSGKNSLDEKFPGGIFTSQGAGGEYVWIAALPPGGLFVESAGERCSTRPRADRVAIRPTRYHPEMSVGPPADRHGIASRPRSSTTSCR